MGGVDPIMTTDERRRRATAFVDRVIELNRDNGGSIALTDAERQQTIEDAVNIFRGLSADG